MYVLCHIDASTNNIEMHESLSKFESIEVVYSILRHSIMILVG